MVERNAEKGREVWQKGRVRVTGGDTNLLGDEFSSFPFEGDHLFSFSSLIWIPLGSDEFSSTDLHRTDTV